MPSLVLCRVSRQPSHRLVVQVALDLLLGQEGGIVLRIKELELGMVVLLSRPSRRTIGPGWAASLKQLPDVHIRTV